MLARPAPKLPPAVEAQLEASCSEEVFDDGPTHTLPSAERTFTDLEPLQLDELGDEDDLAATLEIRRQIATQRFSRASLPAPASFPPIALDARSCPPPARPATLTITAHPRMTFDALLRDPRAPMVVAALMVACVFAGVTGVFAGTTPRIPAAVGFRAPRIAVVTGAREEVTETPAMAPAKAPVEEAVPTPTADPRPRATAPAKRAGFQRPRTTRR